MTVVFMSFFSAIIAERVTIKAGLISLFPSLIMGIASVIYWEFTEMLGRGDLRPYIVVQYGPMLVIPVIIFPSRRDSEQKSNRGVYSLDWQSLNCSMLRFFLGHIKSASPKHLVSAVCVLGDTDDPLEIANQAEEKEASAARCLFL
jgi:hypothetical protein